MIKQYDDNKLKEFSRNVLKEHTIIEFPVDKDEVFISRLHEIHTAGIFDLRALFAENKAFIAAACVAVFLLTGYMFLLRPDTPEATNIEGTVKIYDSSSKTWKFPDRSKVALNKGDILKTFEDGRADIVLGDRYHMRLMENTEVQFNNSGSKMQGSNIKYTLAKGNVLTYFRKTMNGRDSFNINTNNAGVSVVGTNFMVGTKPAANMTWVGVLDGLVKVEGKNKDSVFVKPGQKTSVEGYNKPEEPQRLLKAELMNMQELYRIGRKPQVSLLISTGETRVRELLAVAPLFISSETSDVLPGEMKKIIKTLTEAYRTGSKEKHLENIHQFETLLKEHPDPKYDMQFMLFIGAYYNHLGYFNDAVKTFNSAINKYPGSQLASIAQCAIGIIFEEKVKDLRKAVEAYQKVLSAYPDSPEVEEARRGIERISS